MGALDKKEQVQFPLAPRREHKHVFEAEIKAIRNAILLILPLLVFSPVKDSTASKVPSKNGLNQAIEVVPVPKGCYWESSKDRGHLYCYADAKDWVGKHVSEKEDS